MTPSMSNNYCAGRYSGKHEIACDYSTCDARDMSCLVLDRVFETILNNKFNDDYEFLLGLWRLYYEKVSSNNNKPHLTYLICSMGLEDLMWFRFGLKSINFSIVNQQSIECK